MNFLWKIGGEAGFGIMTTGLGFSTLSSRSGYHVFDYNEYPSLIRGGHNTFEVHFSDREIGSSKWEIDCLVCLNKATYEHHKERLTPQSLVLYDQDDFEFDQDCVKIHIPFKQMRKDHMVKQVMVNTIAMGATMGILGGSIQMFLDLLKEEFQRKGDDIVAFNQKIAQIGYDYILENYKDKIQPVLQQKDAPEKMVLTGNDAFSLATVAADCRFFAAYPMTPASTVLSSLASWQGKTEMLVRHAEDEISVINTALGSSFAGVRSSVATSGGGFALMVEALSYAGVAEIPIVVFLAQRPGPATGMPTWTEQGDLLFACHAGHGEFPKIVLAPGDVYEMAELGLKAYDLADVYQTPVIVISDKFLSESHWSYPKTEFEELFKTHKINRGKITAQTKQEKYLRYKDSEDGTSEWLIPGQKGQFYQANSYEHIEDGHTSELAEARLQQVHKRERKIETYLIVQDSKKKGQSVSFELPRVFGDIEAAEVVFVSWGGNKGIILDAQRLLAEQGTQTAYVHFTHVYPMNEKAVQDFFAPFIDKKRVILVENNSKAQFGQVLRMQTGVTIAEKMLKYDGRPFYAEEIVKRMK